MDISIFLAQAFGLYLLIGGVALLLNRGAIEGFIDMLTGSRSAVMLGGFMVLIIGIPLVLVHNIWDGEPWQTLVTILVWLTFLKGLARVLVPDMVSDWGNYFRQKHDLLRYLIILMVAVGAYLLYVGFGL